VIQGVTLGNKVTRIDENNNFILPTLGSPGNTIPPAVAEGAGASRTTLPGPAAWKLNKDGRNHLPLIAVALAREL
jgi:hypothetical protein